MGVFAKNHTRGFKLAVCILWSESWSLKCELSFFSGGGRGVSTENNFVRFVGLLPTFAVAPKILWKVETVPAHKLFCDHRIKRPVQALTYPHMSQKLFVPESFWTGTILFFSYEICQWYDFPDFLILNFPQTFLCEVFERPPPGVRKIVIATSIAETRWA